MIKFLILAALLVNSIVLPTSKIKTATTINENVIVKTATEPGFKGDINVKVYLKRDRIIKIEALVYADTPEKGGAAVDELIKKVIEKNSADVDTISGATHSSKAFLKAVKKALEKK